MKIWQNTQGVNMKLLFKKIHSDAQLPKKAYSSDAAFDLFSAEEYTLLPQTVTTIHTGLVLAEVPKEEIFFKVESRSGLCKEAIFQVAGVIDKGYQGEWCVMLYNGGRFGKKIKKGERIAQVIPYSIIINAEVEEVKELKEKTERGENGFGSTGT